MELRLQRIALMTWCAAGAHAQTAQAPVVPLPPVGVMRQAVLDDVKPYEVAIGAVPTTILMPEVIEAFEGNNITTAPNTAAVVFLQHQSGTRFFSVKSLLPGTADLNVIVGDRVYSFRFYLSENPTRTLTISPAPSAKSSRPVHTVSITARRLYEILQDAKTYFVIREQHPDLERAIQVTAPGKVLEYPGYRVVIDQVFRFERDDTLVFRALFLNDTAAPLYYQPAEIGLRVGRNLYWPSFAQVPRVIPPRDPARLTWEVSPDVIALEITNPQGQTASLLDRLTAALPEPGEYAVTARAKDGRVDTVKFAVKYPLPAGEPNPLVMAKGAREFGLRRLVLVQPEPGQNFGYVCYTGTADGRRADLSLQNDFTLIVPTHATP
jgi:hypothetical protein